VWQAAAALLGGLVVVWLALVVGLWLRAGREPDRARLTEVLRLVPDVVRLLRRLAADQTLPRGVRIRLGLLVGYLVMPIDLVPDFIPILGYADDAILVVLVLRSVCRRVSTEELRSAWPGTDDGFAALVRLVRPSAVDG
jgi:uncharacterized membrane protein YkvA (DUF1232 family)